MVGGGAFVAAFVVAGQPGQQLLNIGTALDIAQELCRTPTPKRGCSGPVVRDDNVSRGQHFVDESRWSRGVTRWLLGDGWRDGRAPGRPVRR